MRRRSQLGWSSGSSGAIYGGGGTGAKRPLVLVAIVVVAFVAVFLLITRACNTASCDKPYCASDRSIAVPEGYERVTSIFEYKSKETVPAGNNVNVLLPLTKPTTDGRNLSFYSYDEVSKSWSPVTSALLDPSGKQVSATLSTTPPVLTVLKRLLPAGHVVAYLPHDGVLHPDAIGRVTIVHTRDFKPAADGAITGTVTTARNDQGPSDRAAVAFYPSIWADSTDKAAIPIVTTILSSSSNRSTHVQQIMRLVTEGNLAGIDIAYLDLPPATRASFTLFVTELAQQLHGQNKTLTLTLPAPQKTPERIDDGAYDWAELGKAADILQMTPYRDQGTYRMVMPEILQFITNSVQANKVVLTVTPFATEKTTDGLFAIPLTTAMTTATKMGVTSGALITNSTVEIAATNLNENENLSGLRWAPEAACVAFTYRQNGARTVWIENFFSIGFKLEFIPRFKLGGVAVEDARQATELGNIWPALVPFITSGQPVLLQPNPEDLRLQWKASKGAVEGGTKGVVKWATPAEAGPYTITLTVSDGVAQFQNEIPVSVQPKTAPGTPSATVTATAGR